LALTVCALQAAEVRPLAGPCAGYEKGHVWRLGWRLLRLHSPTDAEGNERSRCKCGPLHCSVHFISSVKRWLWEHTARMAKDPKPTFKPLPYKVGTYWRVEVEWPDGFTQHVDDFGSEPEAREWISRKSDDWARKHPRSG
jgi:hypothetical protein